MAGKRLTIRAFALATGALVFGVLAPAAAEAGHDSKPPKTRIVSGPTGTTDDPTPTFEFASNEKRSKFKCQLDGGARSRCKSPYTLPALAAGAHVFDVVAIDRAHNKDRTPAERAFQYVATTNPAPDTTPPDTTPPETTLDSGPSGLTADNDPQFQFSSEPGATFQCGLDGATTSLCTSPQSYIDVADGSHTFSVAACDAAGNCDPTPATGAWTVDTTPPVVDITLSPPTFTSDNTPSVQFTAGDATTVQCQVDSGAFAACSSPFTTATLAESAHTITVRAFDAAGNAGTDSVSFTVDTTPPVVDITVSPPTFTSDNTPSVQFTAGDATTVQCQVDSGAFAACSSPFTTATLAESAHTITVRAFDAAGNAGTDSVSFTVDITPPVVTIMSKPPFHDTSNDASFSFTVTGGTTIQCKLDNAAFAPCTSPQNYTGIASSQHTFTVQSTDAAGNVGQDTWTWDIN